MSKKINNTKLFLEEENCPINIFYPVKEAEYQGKDVELNQPFRTPEGPKKFSVYVKNDKGNVVKVNFGDPKTDIQTDEPDRRKAFRARHKCDQKKDKTKAGWWSCRAWSKDTVAKGLGLDETATAEFWQTDRLDPSTIKVAFNGEREPMSIQRFLRLAKNNNEAKAVLEAIKTKMKEIRFPGNIIDFISQYFHSKKLNLDVFVPNGFEVIDSKGVPLEKIKAKPRFDRQEFDV